MALEEKLKNSLSRTPITNVFADKPAATTLLRKDHNHLFANNVRFLSMAAIIGIHTLENYPSAVSLTSMPPALLYLTQPLKFGTIGFFLVSGFLFGERIEKHSPLGYFKRRLRNVFAPWLVWSSLYFGLRLSADFVHGRLSGARLSEVFTTWKNCFFYSAYWFVPNLLIALALLLVFRRFLNSVRTGLVFLLASLFYGANIYGHWIPVLHTQAVFGFVFYLWLGAWSAWHFQSIEKWLTRIPTAVMLGVILFTLMLALAESKLLLELSSIDPVNTLRISNQLYSIVVVLAIVRLKHSLWPRFVDVREHTFGLYLTHTVALAVICSVLRRLLPRFAILSWLGSSGGALLLVPAMFFLTYLGCLTAVGILRSNRTLRWTVGLPGRRKATKELGVLVETTSPGVYVVGGS